MGIAGIVGILVLAVALPSFLPFNRQARISAIVGRLRQLQRGAGGDLQYALQENISFMQAARTSISYLGWIIGRRRSLDAAKMLELADLGVESWEEALYSHLAVVERRSFPGLLTPLRDHLIERATQHDATVFVDIGCGSMEPARQVVAELTKRQQNLALVWVGVDLSAKAFSQIQRNFTGLDVEIQEMAPAQISLPALRRQAEARKKPIIIFCRADAQKLTQRSFNGVADVVYSCKFKHHLPGSQRLAFDRQAITLGKHVIEYDDYQHYGTWLPPSITAWRRLELLSGAIISQVRQPSKRELQKFGRAAHFFNPPGSYIRVLSTSEEST